MEASGSTLAYQLLAGVVALANATTVVEKRHKKAVGDYGDPRCVALTYRDPRDVVCPRGRVPTRGLRAGVSRGTPPLGRRPPQRVRRAGSHARRRGVPGLSGSCAACSAETLEPRAVGVAKRLFPFHSRRLDAFEAAGALILRYEAFVDCPDALAALFADWLGVAANLPSGFASSLAAASSLEANGARAAALRVFSRFDPATQIHGHHISQGGRTDAWRDDCLTDDALGRVERAAGHAWLERRGYAAATPPPS